jgi:hypothetical protein
MKKLFLSAVLALVLTISIGVGTTHAATTPVTGWAWSDNIGWMQFDTGVSNPVMVDTATGDFSGYAWSDNVGWISFNSSDLSVAPACAGASKANVSIFTGAVTGWIRVVSEEGRSDGWNGCIELSGSNHISGSGGVVMDTATGYFSGYAWSDAVVGWLQFSPTIGLTKCPGCSGGGVAPVVSASCSAVSPITNISPGTSVTFKADTTSTQSPYQYRWSGGATTTSASNSNQFSVTYSASGPGPTVEVGDSSSPINGYSGVKSCPSVTVLPPLGSSNLHINKGNTPGSATTLSSINLSEGTSQSFIIGWNITLPNDYVGAPGKGCTADVSPNPNISNWNNGWRNIILDDGTNGIAGSNNVANGTVSWSGDTSGSNSGSGLSTTNGLGVGTYTFTITCTGGANGTQSTSVKLRVTSTSVIEN